MSRYEEFGTLAGHVRYALAQRVLEGRPTWLEEGIAGPAGDGPMLAERPAEVSRSG